MHGLPPILVTPRLQLRPFVRSDEATLHTFWTDPGVRKYLWDDLVISREQAAEVVATSLHDFAAYGFGHWVSSFHGESNLIGWCGLRHFGERAEVEVLYGILPQFWGQSLAVEATRAVLQYGFEALRWRASLPALIRPTWLLCACWKSSECTLTKALRSMAEKRFLTCSPTKNFN